MGSESVGEISRQKENLTLGDRFQNLCDSSVTSREVTHATTGPKFSKWLVRAIQSLNGGMSHSGQTPISLTCEQFWGRAVQASRDSLDPGRFLFVEVSPRAPSFHFQTIALA
jgi:hypothetical protein